MLNMSANDYIAKMKALAEEMAGARKSISDDELIGYILMGLDEEYNPLVSAIVTRVELIGHRRLAARPLGDTETKAGGRRRGRALRPDAGGGCSEPSIQADGVSGCGPDYLYPDDGAAELRDLGRRWMRPCERRRRELAAAGKHAGSKAVGCARARVQARRRRRGLG
jgi:hypothetical protein